MPIRELRCETESCANQGITFEWLAKRTTSEDPKCPQCGTQMTRLLSTFATPWTGTLDRFKDHNKEPFNDAGTDGHWMWKVKSTSNLDGSPERVLIRTHEDQKRFTKAEGLVMPDDINPNAEIDSDGKKLCTVGMKGQWDIGKPPDSIRETGNPWLYTDE